MLASGIDPLKTTIFLQSDLKYLMNLLWVIKCLIPLNLIKKQRKQGLDKENLGGFSRDLLKSANLLAFNPKKCIFGENYKNTLEFTNTEIIDLFNNSLFDKKFFNKLEMYKAPYYGIYSIKDLQDANFEMKRLSIHKRGTLYLDDNEKIAKDKIIRAKTDSIKDVSKNIVSKINRFILMSKKDQK